MRLVDCVDIETSSSHRQCRRVIDEKISDRIVVSSIERRDYSARRSSDSSITLIYWESLSSSSLLDVKSFIYSRGKSRAQENDQNAFSFIDQRNIERLRSHVYTNSLFNVYVTQVKSREEKSYSVQSHSIFSSCASLFHHIFLCSMNDNHWVREHSSTYVTITSITSAKKTSFVFESRIESRHRCIKYRQWRAEQRRCIIIKQHRHSHQEFTRASRAE